jgi:hypothetical protein
MSEQPQWPVRHEVGEVYILELARGARVQRRERERAAGGADRYAHPLVFDESGFAIPQRPRLAERIARRLNPL